MSTELPGGIVAVKLTDVDLTQAFGNDDTVLLVKGGKLYRLPASVLAKNPQARGGDDAPSNAVGDNDDIYVESSGKIYQKRAGGYVLIATIKIPEATSPATPAVLDEAIPTDVIVGALNAGVTLPKGMTFTEYVKAISTKIFTPTLNGPSFGLSHNQGGLRKVAEFVNVALTFNYDQGSIYQPWNSQTQNPRSGAATNYNFLGTINQATNIYTKNNHQVIAGNNSFSATITYAAGPQPKDSKGGNFDQPLAGSTATRSTSFEGVYAIYATSQAITNLSEQALASQLNGWQYVIDLASESGQNKQTFWLPNYLWTINRPLSGVQLYNPLTGSFDNANKITDFTVSAQTIAGVAGKTYTYNGPGRGAVKIRITS